MDAGPRGQELKCISLARCAQAYPRTLAECKAAMFFDVADYTEFFALRRGWIPWRLLREALPACFGLYVCLCLAGLFVASCLGFIFFYN